MPTLTRWLIKTSLVYLLLAFLVGILMAAQSANRNLLPSLALFPGYVHMLVIGWLTFLIIGIAFWMFPKFSKEQPRGFEALGWTAYILINLGLLLRLVGEPIQAGNAFRGWLLVVSAALQWLGALAFVMNTWPRVKEK